MDLFQGIYYFALFCFPILTYFVLIKSNRRTKYSKPVWYHFLKKWVAKKAVRKMQLHSQLALETLTDAAKEEPKKIRNEKESDAHIIYACDVDGNVIILKIILRQQNHAEVSIKLKLANGKMYELPNEPQVLLCSTVSRKWKAENLEITVLEPLKRLRITYNGLLKCSDTPNAPQSDDNIEHVKFNFLWNCASKPLFYPHDVSEDALADAVAIEQWKDGYWIEMLNNEKGYEQFGELKGFIKGSKFDGEYTVAMPSWRKRYYGVADSYSLNRDLSLFGVATDGTLFNIGVKSYSYGCTHMKYGSVLTSTLNLYALDDHDINLEFIGENGNIPSAFTVHFYANKKTYKCIFHVNKDMAFTTYSNDLKGWKTNITYAECDLLTHQARGLVITWYMHYGSGVEMPARLLRDGKRYDKGQILVTSLSDKESRVLSLTGGKGNSLALLSTINTAQFTVPEGFIVTVDAFKKQLETNEKLRDAVLALEQAAMENLAAACERTMEIFANEDVNEEIRRKVIVQLNSIQARLEENGVKNLRWAVRSSGIGEDSEELSTAGQNSTFLGRSSEDAILKAIAGCWASLFSFQSVRYRKQHGLSVSADIAVVVQRMINSDVAGVLFTCHPTSGDPSEMVITANYGLGESVVSGQADPDTIILKRTWEGKISIKSETVGAKKTKIKMSEESKDIDGTQVEEVDESQTSALCLTPQQAILLGEIGVKLEKAFGNARDIEWAFYENKLYLLQSRPVTTLNTWTNFELLHEFDTPVLSKDNLYTRANVGEVMVGAMTPLSQSVIVKTISNAIQLELGENNTYINKSIAIERQHTFLDMYNGLYYRTEKEISLSTKMIDISIIGHPYMDEHIHSVAKSRYGVSTLKQQMNEIKVTLQMAWNLEKIVERARSIGKVASRPFLPNNTCLDTLRQIKKNFKILEEIGGLHCKTSRISCFYQFVAMSVLVGNSKDFTSEHYKDISFLLSSCEGVVSAEIPVALGNIAHIIHEKNLSEEFANLSPKECASWMKSKVPKAYEELQAFLRKHSHRSFREFELKEKNWGINPEKIMTMIQANAKTKTFTKKATNLSVGETIAKLSTAKNKITRYIMRWLIGKCRMSVRARENTKSELIRVVQMIGLDYRELARKMVTEGYITDPELIYHFTNTELEELLTKRNPTLTFKAIRRQRLYPEWDKERYPEMNFGHPEPEKEDAEVLEMPNGGLKMTGTPVYQGNVVARCSVIRDLGDIGELQSGDILITHSTDIGWSPYFPMLAGIVTELGGLISHGAVVAREYGLPSIVGVTDATKYFKTGDKILLNGSLGTLELISRP